MLRQSANAMCQERGRMMRLIDADAVRQKREDFAVTSNAEMNRFNRMFVDLFNREIDKAPTIDAVPVVRCKDCKYWGNSLNWDGHIVGGCDFVEMVTDEDGYCYRAYRKEVQDE